MLTLLYEDLKKTEWEKEVPSPCPLPIKKKKKIVAT